MSSSSPRKASDLARPRPLGSTSDFGFLAGAQPAASGSGPQRPNNTAGHGHCPSRDPPSPRKLKHGRTTSVPNLHKLSTGGPTPALSHSRSRSWLATLLKPGSDRGASERGQAYSHLPATPVPSMTPPGSPAKGAGMSGKAWRGTLGGTLRRKVEVGASGLGLPFASSDRGGLEFGCAGSEGEDEVEELELTIDPPKRPQRPREELDQDLVSIRLREGPSFSPSRHSTYTPTSPRLRLSQYGTHPMPPPPPYASLIDSNPESPTEGVHPSPRSHPPLTALRAIQPPPRLRPRSAHRTDAVELTREWKAALEAIPDASFEGSGQALASLLSQLGGECGGAGLSRSKRREAPVVFDPLPAKAPHDSLSRLRGQAGLTLTHSASLVSLSAFPSPPLAGAAGFIHPPSSAKSLAERRARLVEPLVFEPPSAFDDDDSPQPSAVAAAYTSEEERGRIVFSPFRTDSIVDHGARYSIVVERETDAESSVESACGGVEEAEDRLCAAGWLGVNMIGSHFSPITNSSNSSFEGSQADSVASAGHSPTTTARAPDVCGLEIDGLSLKQLGLDRPYSLLPSVLPLNSHLYAREHEHDHDHLDLPPSSTFTSASFSPFSGSVASFSTNPSSLDGDRDALALPENVKWRWERSGVFPPSSSGSAAPSRSASGASSLMPSPMMRSAAGRSVSGLSVLDYYATLEGDSPALDAREWDEGDTSAELDSSQGRWEAEMLRQHKLRTERAVLPVGQRSEREDGEVAWGVAL